MSRIGKQLIDIPEAVEVKLEDGLVLCHGPKGDLNLKTPKIVCLTKNDKNQIKVEVKNTANIKHRAFWGTYNRLIKNMILGVKEGYEKKLEIQGIGFRAALKDDLLILNVGFSHPVEFKKPAGVDIKVEENIITISGIDKQLVGETAAQIKRIKKPDAYKGKGIRYLGEQIKLKPGKQVKGAEGKGK